jgi:hypothetical protein
VHKTGVNAILSFARLRVLFDLALFLQNYGGLKYRDLCMMLNFYEAAFDLSRIFIPLVILMFRNKDGGISGCSRKRSLKRNVFLTTTIRGRD